MIMWSPSFCAKHRVKLFINYAPLYPGKQCYEAVLLLFAIGNRFRKVM